VEIRKADQKLVTAEGAENIRGGRREYLTFLTMLAWGFRLRKVKAKQFAFERDGGRGGGGKASAPLGPGSGNEAGFGGR